MNVALGATMVASLGAVTGNRATAAPARAGGSVTFATWDSNPTEKSAQQKLVAQFEKKTGITVNFEVLSGDYNAQLKSRITAGTAPDVFYINSDHIRDYITTGALKNLDFLKKVKGLGFTSQFYKNLQAGYNYKGHAYAVVKDVSTLALWYNKDMFKAAGIKTPPATWAQLKTDACKLTDKSKKVAGISLSADPARWIVFLQEMGGAFLNKGQTKATLNTTAAKQALSYYTSLSTSGCAQRPDQIGAGWNGEAFGKQTAAMAIEGNWMTSFMQQTYPGVHWGVAQVPAAPNGKRSNVAFTAGYAMFARTKNLTNATKLMEYLISKQGEKVWAHVAGYVSPRKDVTAPAGTKIFTTAITYSKDWFFPSGFADRALTPLGTDIQKVQDGQMSVSSALSDMQSKETAALSTAP
jgi:multiple sugar transport system substrate-binding protein